jgi:hypothetical protein
LIAQFPRAKLAFCLAAVHGDEAVHGAGIAELGYPGTWATDIEEARAIEKWFNDRHGE